MSGKVEETVKQTEKKYAGGLRKGLQSATSIPNVPEPPTPQPRKIVQQKKD
jgi:hypothetical protein